MGWAAACLQVLVPRLTSLVGKRWVLRERVCEGVGSAVVGAVYSVSVVGIAGRGGYLLSLRSGLRTSLGMPPCRRIGNVVAVVLTATFGVALMDVNVVRAFVLAFRLVFAFEVVFAFTLAFAFGLAFASVQVTSLRSMKTVPVRWRQCR